MSKISLAPAVAGTGIFTIASPGTSTNRTLTLPDDTGTIVTNSGNQAGSFTTLNTSGQVVFNDAGADVDFRVEGDTNANLLFVDASADRVGIGTNTPNSQLQVAGTGVINTRASSTSNTGEAAFFAENNDSKVVGPLAFGSTHAVYGALGSNETAFYSNVSTTVMADAAAGIIKFATGGNTERMRITSAGNLLVGTTTGQAGNNHQFFSSNGNSTVLIKTEDSNASSIPLAVWNNAGSGDNIFVQFYFNAIAVGAGGIDFNRTAGLVRYNTTSDATLKNIIGDSDGQKSIEILNSTRIREFAWKDDETQKPQIGVIAQELYKTYRGAVSVGGDYEVTIPAVTEQQLISEAVLDEDGNEIKAAVYETVEVELERTETKYCPWGVDKTAFTFHLVAGWQAHEKIIKQQADMIAALEARIAALEAQ